MVDQRSHGIFNRPSARPRADGRTDGRTEKCLHLIDLPYFTPYGAMPKNQINNIDSPLAALITHWRSFFEGIACANYIQETPFRDVLRNWLRRSSILNCLRECFAFLNSQFSILNFPFP